MNRICIFDLDGTLIHSMPYYTKALFDILDEEGVSYDPDEMVGIITPRGYTKSAEYFVEELGVKDTVEHLVHRMGQKLEPAYLHEIRLKPFVKAESGRRATVRADRLPASGNRSVPGTQRGA